MSALTFHGGQLDEASLRFPGAEQPWTDLSTGINPNPYPTSALGNADPCALPTASDLAALETAAADAFGISVGAVAALPGTEVGLRLLATLGLPEPAYRVAPAYGTYATAVPTAKSVAIADLAVRAVDDAATMLLANPNNPDGRVVTPDAVLDLARALRQRGGWLVIDEAFADTDPGSSILPLLEEPDPVLVFRSFGKFYGLAGVRLGFVCGPEEMVTRFRDRLGAWPVSSAAIAIGTAAYRDLAWQSETRQRLARSVAHLDAVLRRHGLEPIGECALFRLVDTPDATAIFERLGHAGILTRPFDYAPTWLRFGLPRDAAALDRLDRALGDR